MANGSGAEVRPYGDFVQVPPEVVESVKRWRDSADVTDEVTILNWAAQAVATQENEK